ncbi:hypothetical protein BYT27DRAFT_7265614 [Phlegmacium glaucopus]|nr:hypothetical protein BYT27DRAFT_7265614 [Phlegmacium glaucopus]
MSNTFILPSYFGTPFITDIPSSRYDSTGRQLSFVETEVQRLERMALVRASKRRSQPGSGPRMKLIDNRLAEEYLFNDVPSPTCGPDMASGVRFLPYLKKAIKKRKRQHIFSSDKYGEHKAFPPLCPTHQITKFRYLHGIEHGPSHFTSPDHSVVHAAGVSNRPITIHVDDRSPSRL